MKAKVNVASATTAKRIFMAWAYEVTDIVSNILYFANDAEARELRTACEGKCEWDYVLYTCNNIPSLRNRIAAKMAGLF